ncbi:hypothetical protein WJX82_006718 [Trebouxia sp. C0006]
MKISRFAGLRQSEVSRRQKVWQLTHEQSIIARIQAARTQAEGVDDRVTVLLDTTASTTKPDKSFEAVDSNELLLQLSESKQQLQISAKRLSAAEQLSGHKERSVEAVEQYAAYLEHELSQSRGTHGRLRTQYDADMFDMEQQVSDLQEQGQQTVSQEIDWTVNQASASADAPRADYNEVATSQKVGNQNMEDLDAEESGTSAPSNPQQAMCQRVHGAAEHQQVYVRPSAASTSDHHSDVSSQDGQADSCRAMSEATAQSGSTYDRLATLEAMVIDNSSPSSPDSHLRRCQQEYESVAAELSHGHDLCEEAAGTSGGPSSSTIAPKWSIAASAATGRDSQADIQKPADIDVAESDTSALSDSQQERQSDSSCSSSTAASDGFASNSQAQPSTTGKEAFAPGSFGLDPFSVSSVQDSEVQDLRAAYQNEVQGQAAFEYHMTGTQELLPDHLDEPIPLQTWELASEEYQDQALLQYETAAKQKYTDDWEWELAPFSPRVRVLKKMKKAPLIGVLGQGAGSEVLYVEAVYPDGSVEPGAGKVMPYHTAEEQRKVNNELAALQDAEDCPLLGQLLAVFTHMDPADGKQYLWMILEYEEGCDFIDAKNKLLEKLEGCRDGESKFLAAMTSIGHQAAKAVDWLHARGRAHCDVKGENLRITVSQDGIEVQVKVIDFGCSVKYRGLKKHAWKAGLHLGCSYDMAAPEWLAIDSDAFIDACAQDVWSIGCLIYRMLTGCMAWEAEGSSYQFVMGILQAHRQWAHALSLPCNHPERLKHHLIQNLQRFSAMDGTNTLTELMQRMLHPDCTQRATLQEVLASALFPPASSEVE